MAKVPAYLAQAVYPDVCLSSHPLLGEFGYFLDIKERH
jgi:hypothetical protein